MNGSPKIDTRQRTGELGEAAVRDFVRTLGWKIIDHNVRWREGELDLIAVDGHTVVFAEVKSLLARQGGPSFSPFESIDARKQTQVRSLARRWLSDDIRRVRSVGTSINHFRFDAFAVTIGPGDDVLDIEHLEDAF